MNNYSTVTGNLTADPELKYFDSGSVKTTFSVACTRTWKGADGEKQEQTSFIDVTAWRFLAEDAARALTKGSRVSVSGRIEQQSWDDKETGTKRSKIIIVADEIAVAISQIESYERRKRENAEGAPQGQTRTSNQSRASQGPSRSSQTRVPAAATASRKPAVSREELEPSDEPF